jgi:hypothetical protein
MHMLSTRKSIEDIEDSPIKIMKKCEVKHKIPKALGQAEKEADLLRDVLAFFKDEPETFCCRIDGVGKLMRGVMIPSSHAGFPDIVCITQGVFYGIELKAKGGTLSDKQKKLLNNMQEAGANVGIVMSIHGLRSMLSNVACNALVENVRTYW